MTDSKMLKGIEAAIKEHGRQLEEMTALLVAIQSSVQEIAIGNEMSSISKVAAPKKAKTDIITFIKTRYSEDTDFFGDDVSESKISEIREKVAEKNKKLSEPELLKKVAASVWKDVIKPNKELATKYQELKKNSSQEIEVPEVEAPAPKAPKSKKKAAPPVAADSDSDADLLE